MPPLRKKQRTSSLGGNSREEVCDSSDARINDASPSIKPSEANHTFVALTDEEAARLLQNLWDSNTVKGAIKAVEELLNQFRPEIPASIKAIGGSKIMQLNGVGAILKSLEKWHMVSSQFAYYAMRDFPKIVQMFTSFGGLKAIEEAADKSPHSYSFRSNLVGLICNASSSTLEGVEDDDCVTVVLDAMKLYPYDDSIQLYGCSYLVRIALLNRDDVKERVRKRAIFTTLGTVLDTYKHRSEEIFLCAQEAMTLYLTT